MKKKAFTLAEVLITLTIIGVIAAITIPNLISSYKKMIVISKLKKTVAQLNHAIQLAKRDYTTIDGPIRNNASSAADTINTIYKPYLNITNVEEYMGGAFAYFPDGSGLYLKKTAGDNYDWGSTYLLICINKKACKEIKDNKGAIKINGKDTFDWGPLGKAPLWSYKYTHQTRDKLIEGCRTSNSKIELCTVILWLDSWQIKDDYPIKI